MRIFPSQLGQHLNKLPPILMVFGDDVLIREECRDALRQACYRLGAQERLSLVQESPFNWDELRQECQSLSLFASSRVIELELPSLKPGTDGAAVLAELAEELSHQQDLWLLLHGPKAGRDQTNTKWFKALDKHGLYVQALTPEGPHYQRWIAERARRHQLQLDRDGQNYLASLFEGNLLAADQAMAQLALIAPGQRLGQEALAEHLQDQSRYSVFELADALLAGNVDGALKILSQLRQEGTAATLVSWAVNREWALLLGFCAGQANGQSMAELMKAARVWEKRQRLYQNCLNRLGPERISAAMAAAGALEAMLKGEHQDDAAQWLALADLCARFDPQYQPMVAL
ncbi:DNA polymerase III subunit delta [Ferrimonas balearica]|uniref:DNA polymerase III subunit delta n=1 Tax=Ferrimonas balearica TaxID=44012 RepID=UPI001C59D700|nr:DNA polymerase III subunit delta [Ferrimonas balearica]MBW3137927.1 DNA polymerase III subunit delta [Ferrimonas balearica]MBW3164506.1 DNA polymerase III subunit delta [Ferrimonas balearica]MBY5978695.1 DNA polymerase III subunit delta [Ferrimonas balearica]MBY6104933.1 DNA polymerase III subunit delta [Ferrimonas balearica]